MHQFSVCLQKVHHRSSDLQHGMISIFHRRHLFQMRESTRNRISRCHY
ncbi:hypothetical protein NECAME_06547 [Necator americanus]|uniref:Uncharacterized protein n=1 Tax=Necator americanus TaxID=51031 RepID=W2TTP3_NECAM|nr:hypothetical protein NECAME_06547 [Necator americanus]ETN85158.1 hypothetical protein NECAME_06547 [Necator americanus]